MKPCPFYLLFLIWWGYIALSLGQFRKYEQPLVIQPSSVSITSITYNPSPQQSEWVRRIFGEEAIFHNRSMPSKSPLSLSPEEKLERLHLFRKHFRLPLHAMNPSCSFEMLGYVVADVGEPITFASHHIHPAIGEATLHFGELRNESWICYYRAMYDNNFMKLKMKPYHHWPVFLFCPAPVFEYSCRKMLEIYKQHYTGKWKTMGIHDLLGIKPSSIRFGFANYDVTPPHTNMDTYSEQRQDPHELVTDTNENAHFDTILMPATLEINIEAARWEVDLTLDLFNTQRKPKNTEEMAVCTTIPYLSSSDEKVEVNSVMIFEFIRHYSNLGFKVMIYDRLGRNYEHIFNHPYSQRFRRDHHSRNMDSNDKAKYGNGNSPHSSEKGLNFRYYNYTMLQKLGGYRYDIRYENTLGLSAAVLYTDMDKQLTYTHCRFAVKNLYGIENVMIADFDEFLYCPRARGSATAQRNFIQNYFHHMKAKGIEQLHLKQRVLVSKTSNMQQCMLRQINATKRGDQRQFIASPYLRQSKTEEKIITAPASLSQTVLTNPNYDEASIFHCLAPYNNAVRTYFDKSILFGHHCPFTSYHYSSYKRQYDCFALSYISGTKKKRNYSVGGCGVVHITTRNSTYNRTHSHNVASVLDKPNELYFVANKINFPSKESEVVKK